MRIKIITAICAVGLLATGCAGGGGSEDGTESAPSVALLPQKLAEPTPLPELEVSPSPAADSTFSENVEYELRGKTLDMAREDGETSADCPAGLGSKSGTMATCTTTYEGLKVLWDVNVGDKSAWSDNVVEYQARPRKGIITPGGVARIIYGNSSGTREVRCNNIPEAVLVPLNVKTTYTCQNFLKGDGPPLTGVVQATDVGPRVY